MNVLCNFAVWDDLRWICAETGLADKVLKLERDGRLGYLYRVTRKVRRQNPWLFLHCLVSYWWRRLEVP